jgi:acetyl-CoA synthetase
MSNLLDKYLPRTRFDSYEDFKENFRIKIPKRFNFAFDVVDETARRWPGKRALVWCDENGAEATFTFADMKERSDRTANFLKSLGIRKGDPVMLILKRRYEFWFCALALHKLGAITIPATHLLTDKDIAYRNNAAGVKMIIAVDDPAILDRIDKAQKGSPTLSRKVVLRGSRPGWESLERGIKEASERFVRPGGAQAPSNGDCFLLYFTSGTTGHPKMVRHNFVYPLGHIVTAAYWQNVRDEGLHFTVAETGWAKAAWGKIYGQWIAGSAVFAYDYDRFVPQDLLRLIEKHRINTFCAPPTVFRYLIKENLSHYDFRSLEYCLVAGEPLNPEVYQQWLNATGTKLMEGYGQTETTILVANYPWMDPVPGSMGKPSPLYDVDIINDAGESCEAGEEGQIAVRTGDDVPVGMFQGYYRDEALTARVWRDGFYMTGDVAYKDESGYFWFVGRTDDCFKSSGYRIGPFEVESALLEHPAVLECAVTGVPDAQRGQAVKASVVLAKGFSPSAGLVKELQEHVKKVTAPYKYPRIVEFVTELPKTISGKIRRVEIRSKETRRA